MENLEEKRALSIAEVSIYACVSRGIVESWLNKGLLPYEELPGKGRGSHKFRRIRRTDIDNFLDHHYKQPKAEGEKEAPENRLTLLPRPNRMRRREMLES